MEGDQYSNSEYKKIDKDFRRETAVVKAKPKLIKLGLFLFFVVDAVLIFIFIFYVLSYLILGSSLQKQQVAGIMSNLGSFREITVKGVAKPLEIEATRIFSSASQKYDFYVKIINPNSNWYAQFDYFFRTNEGDTDSKRGFVLPASEQSLVNLGLSYNRRPFDAELVIENITWVRIDPHKIDNIEVWLQKHNGFEVKNSQYSLDIDVGDKRIARSSFEIFNNTSYGYWSPKFLILLVKNGVIQGVNTTSLAGFAPGESRAVNLNWFGNVPRSAEILIIPQINFFNDDIYMSDKTTKSIDIRDSF